ncbi:MAG TPA: PSD1 and planctomycete cytochrome C domain-containing protein, partial [Gemmataceae bacterium]|nr:PSD1 and planctomycete cytochrome C domain-containing protein [Gemmataceae bacterium]
MRRLPLVSCALLILTATHLHADEPRPNVRPVEFNRDIRPIISDNCYTCHGPAKSARKADLRLDTQDGLFADLGGYRAVVPGKPEQSHLWQRVSSVDAAKRMPPSKSGRQLTPQQLDLLRRWIEQGAKWQNHWSFIPPQRPPLPAVKDVSWPRNPLDHFIRARLEGGKFKPAPEASRETLIRRVTLDLTGLPPTLAEIDAFLADTSPNAYEKVVDRLLASPRYGERMVLEWLDAARYADSNGYQTDGTRPMWPWRDWVIDALNANMPFDQFTLEMLAGDMLPGATLPQKIATGFNRNHMLNGEGGRIAEESRVDYVVDRVETTATVWLGLTAGCGRCHDHKYDPISQKEFYRLYAYFNNVAESGSVDRRSSTAAPVLELPTAEENARIAAKTKAIASLEADLRSLGSKLLAGPWEKMLKTDRMTAELVAILRTPKEERSPRQAKALADHYLTVAPERQALQARREKERKALDTLKKSVLITMVMEERPQPRDTFVLLRGAYDKYGEKVGPGVPACLPPLPKEVPNNRLGLAKWLVDRSNPLTARVTVNRLWQMHFGTGLVKTTEDFGSQGESPSHPELLDWLATEFARGWDVKALQRLIVTSATYRQASRVTPDLLERDPDNRLLTRGPRQRLNAFVLRDQALALSGLLVERRGGPPVRPYQPPGIWEEMSFGFIKYVQDKGEGLYRRSLYTFWRRSVGPTNLFDTAPRQVCTVRLPRTNTPLHALVLMNDTTYVE